MTTPRKATTANRSGRLPRKTAGESSARHKKQKQAHARVVRNKRIAPEQSPSAAPPRQTKKATVIALLQRPDGSAIDYLIVVTAWQAHSARAALTGLRRKAKAL